MGRPASFNVQKVYINIYNQTPSTHQLQNLITKLQGLEKQSQLREINKQINQLHQKLGDLKKQKTKLKQL